jgi:hypothetical protein
MLIARRSDGAYANTGPFLWGDKTSRRFSRAAIGSGACRAKRRLWRNRPWPGSKPCESSWPRTGGNDDHLALRCHKARPLSMVPAGYPGDSDS